MPFELMDSTREALTACPSRRIYELSGLAKEAVPLAEFQWWPCGEHGRGGSDCRLAHACQSRTNVRMSLFTTSAWVVAMPWGSLL